MKVTSKKVLAVFLAVVMMVSILVVPAGALEVTSKDDAAIVVTIGDATISDTETTVDVPVSVEFVDENAKFDAFGLQFSFDTENFVMHTASGRTDTVFGCAGTLCDAISGGPTTNRASYADSTGYGIDQAYVDELGSSVLFYLRFDAVEGYINGEYTVDADIIDNAEGNSFAYKSDDNDVLIVPGTITMTGGIDLAPEIGTQPVGGTYDYGVSAPVSVAATIDDTSASLSYQWYVDGEAVNGATNAKYDLQGYAAKAYEVYCEVTANYPEGKYDKTQYSVKSETATVTVNKLDISGATIAVAGVDVDNNIVYTGTAQEPDVTVTVDGAVLTKGTDYTVAYTNNTNVGTATVTVTGTGNCSGSATATWNITNAKITGVAETATVDVYTGGEAVKLSVNATTVGGNTPTVTYKVTAGGENITYDETNLTVAAKESGVGKTATITATVTAANHDTVTQTITVNVSSKKPATVTISDTVKTEAEYIAAGHALSEFVTDADITVDQTADGTWTYTLDGEAVTDFTAAKLSTVGEHKFVASWVNDTHAGSAELTITITKANVTVTIGDIAAQTYTGEAKEPAVTVSTAAGTLAETDYTVSYANNTNAGTATVTVTAAEDSNYSFTAATKEFTIEPSTEVTDATVKTQNVVVGVGSFAEPSFTGIGGEAVEGTVTYTYDGAPKSKTEIETALAALAKDATATIGYSFEAEGNYTGIKTDEIAVTMVDILFKVGEDLATAENALTVAEAPVYGMTWNQIVTVKSSSIKAVVDTTEVPGTYTVENGETLPNAGKQTYKVLFTSSDAESKYKDVVVVSGEVEIAQKEVAVAWTGTTVTYNGEAQAPTATANGVDGAVELKLAYTEGEAAVESPKDAGTYTATASTENGNYTLTNTTTTFTINPKALSNVQVDFDIPEDGVEYNATEHKPAAVLTADGVIEGETLAVDKDYTITYTNNKNAGTATVTVTAAEGSNYTFTGSKTANFTISPVTLSEVTIGAIEALTFNGAAQEPALTVDATGIVEGDTLKAGHDYTAVYGNNTNASTEDAPATVTITCKTGGNYTFGEVAPQTFVINKATTTNINAAAVLVKYNDPAEKTVSIVGIPANAGTVICTPDTVADADGILNAESISAEPGLVKFAIAEGLTEDKAGKTATIPVTVTMQNYEDVPVNVVVTLTEKSVPVLSANDITVTYTGEALTADAITGTATYEGAAVTGTWAFVDTMTEKVNAGIYTVTVKFTPEDAATYAEGTVVINLTVNKAKPVGTVTTEPASVSAAGTKLSGVTLIGADTFAVGETNVPGRLAWEQSGDTDVTRNTYYKWIFTPTDVDNYETVTGTIRLWKGSSSSGGGGSSSSSKNSISAPTTSNGSVTVSPASAAKGSTVTITVEPDAGYTLDSLIVTDSKGNRVALTDKGNGSYTFTMPDSKVTVTAVFAEESGSSANIFVDVAADAYYYDAVLWAVEKGITDGTSDTTFSPNAACTRAQMMTFLWRAAGKPAPSVTTHSFTDVDANAYYYDALLWAIENGITDGTSDTTFSPNATCTRGQMATFLHRYADTPAAGSSNPFADVGASDYFHDAVLWAAGEGITDGTSDTTFSPSANCTRAQMVTFLYRFLGE